MQVIRFSELSNPLQADMGMLYSRLLYADPYACLDFLEEQNPEVYPFLLSYRVEADVLKRMIISLKNNGSIYEQPVVKKEDRVQSKSYVKKLYGSSRLFEENGR